MKNYTLGSGDRVLVIVLIALIAFFLTNLELLFAWLNAGLTMLGEHTGFRFPQVEDEVAWYGVSAFSLPVVAGIFWLFNNYLWRWFARFIGVPNLNGEWFGALDRVDTASGALEESLPIAASIRQTYMRMSFQLSGSDEESISGPTRSEAISMSLDGDAATGFVFNHMYRVLPAGSYGACTLNLARRNKKDTLEGEYAGSAMRHGRMVLVRIAGEDLLAAGEIKEHTSATGKPFLAIPVESRAVDKWRRKLGRRKGHEEYSRILANRTARDGNMHHMTIVTPDEYVVLSPEQIDIVTGRNVQFALIGLGHFKRDRAQTCFVVAKCPHAALLRSRAGLGAHDFHVTLGFDPEDIHDCPKDESTIFA